MEILTSSLVSYLTIVIKMCLHQCYIDFKLLSLSVSAMQVYEVAKNLSFDATKNDIICFTPMYTLYEIHLGDDKPYCYS